MFDMVLTSAKLFLTGKLFRNPLHVLAMSAIGVALTFAVAALLLFVVGLAPPLAAGISGLIGGLAQPFLFKNLKYK